MGINIATTTPDILLNSNICPMKSANNVSGMPSTRRRKKSNTNGCFVAGATDSKNSKQ